MQSLKEWNEKQYQLWFCIVKLWEKMGGCMSVLKNGWFQGLALSLGQKALTSELNTSDLNPA